MTPYLIAGTWIDLDHVLAIQDRQFTREQQIGWADGWYGGNVTLAFRDSPLTVVLGRDESTRSGTYVPSQYAGSKYITAEQAQTIWDAFIAAWKARSTSNPVGSAHRVAAQQDAL